MSPSELPSGYGIYLLQTLLALGAVCLLAFVVLKGLAKRTSLGTGGGGRMRVLDRVALDQHHALVLVEVEGRFLIVGVGGAGGAQLVTELEGPLEELEAGTRSRSFKELLGQIATKTKGGQSQGPG